MKPEARSRKENKMTLTNTEKTAVMNLIKKSGNKFAKKELSRLSKQSSELTPEQYDNRLWGITRLLNTKEVTR